MKTKLDLHRWTEVSATFEALVELDEHERSVELERLSRSDPELHAAVDALLAGDTAAESRLASLEMASRLPTLTAPDPLRLTGRTVSHFQVAESIGAGGMGVVYRAVDTNLGRSVALKLLLPVYNLDSAARARFLHEGQSAAALDHQNLCAVHEVGISEDGWMFLAMPLYEGETLRTTLSRDGALPISTALDIARQIADGLAAAHDAGIMHRDLKPGNIMLLPGGGVRILDFGLAKAIDQSLSATTARLGTMAYMSPEQIRGDKVDARSDLWALGVVLYEMLAGCKPFGGDDVAIAHAILHTEPPPLSTHRPGIPIATEELVDRLLKKDRRRRYVSANQLLGDLAQATNVGAQRDEQLRRFIRTGKNLLLRKAWVRWTALGALILGTLSYAALASKAPSSASGADATIAVLPFHNLTADTTHAYVADMLYQEILTQLSSVTSLKVIARASVAEYTGPNRPSLRQIARELGVRNIVEATVQVVGGRLHMNVDLMNAVTGTRLWTGEYDRAFDDAAFALQSDVARQIVTSVGAELTAADAQRVGTMPTASKEAYLYYQQALYYLRAGPFGRPNLDFAQQLLTRALSLDTGFAAAHAALSEMHRQMYWYRADRTPARLARERSEAETALRLGPNLPQAHRAMAAYYQMAGSDPHLMLSEIRIALREAPNDADTWENLARAHRNMGNWDSSLVAFQKARELSPRDPFLILNHGNWTNTRLRRFPETIAWLDTVAKHWPDLWVIPIGKGWNYAAWTGQLDSLRVAMNGAFGREVLEKGPIVLAFEFLRVTRQPDSLLRLLAKMDRQWGGGPHDVSHPFHYIPLPLYSAWAHEMRGDSSAARAAFDSALVQADAEIRRAPDDWPVHQARGMALAGLGRRAEALRETQSIRQNRFYKNAFIGPTLRLAAAEVLAQCGDAAAAVEDLEDVLTEGAFGNILQIGITVHSLQLDPTWDPIRNDPRFKALLDRHS